jgi:hypothetical protein
MYGCENRKKSHKYLKEQIFPYMLGKNAKDRFNFEDCRFTVTRDKEATGRIVFKNMGIMNSYTLEASYGGSSLGNKAYSHFTPRDYQNMGRYFCETLLDFNDPSPPKEQLRYKILLGLLRQKSLATEPNNIRLSDYSSLSSSDNDYTDGLDEEPSPFLFQRVKKKLRRRLRKKPLITPFSHLKPRRERKEGEETPSATESSESSESSSEPESSGATASRRTSSARCSLHSFQERRASSTLEVSEISEDEDAIRFDVMRSFHRLDHMHTGTGETLEFSASACQRIHAELLASVNQIYMNLSESGLKNSSSSSSSLSVTKKNKITKTKSIELKPSHDEVKEERSSSIAEITLKKSVIKRLKKKMANPDISEEDKSNPDLLADSEDRMKMAVLKKMKKKKVKEDSDEVKLDKVDSSVGSPGRKEKRLDSGKMKIFIQQKMEKRPKLPQ